MEGITLVVRISFAGLSRHQLRWRRAQGQCHFRAIVDCNTCRLTARDRLHADPRPYRGDRLARLRLTNLATLPSPVLGRATARNYLGPVACAGLSPEWHATKRLELHALLRGSGRVQCHPDS